ncbi:hypothetical protein BDQ17DRAFT_1323195 [Cyathus striatus]|nr:hypothetical protein BDQ17DRAFT_1323195 [Cyathus striatus]
MVQGHHPYPTITRVMVESGLFPALTEHYRTPPRVPPEPIVPQFFSPVLRSGVFDVHFTCGSRYNSGFFMPTELDNESLHPVYNADASNLGGRQRVGRDKIKKASAVVVSLWRNLLKALRRRPTQDREAVSAGVAPLSMPAAATYQNGVPA